VRAAISFVEAGGKEAIITRLQSALAAVEGEMGTHVVA